MASTVRTTIFSRDLLSHWTAAVAGIVKSVATAIAVFFVVETLGRRVSLFISAMSMGIVFYILGAILKTHPPVTAASPPPSSKAMAAMIYLFVCFYSMGWGEFTSWDTFPSSIDHWYRTGTMDLRVWHLSHSHKTLRPCSGKCFTVAMEWVMMFCHVLSALMTFSRLRRDQVYSPDDYQPRVQDLYHVCDCEHWSDGNIFTLTSRDQGKEFGGDGYHLWCCLSRREAGLYQSAAERYATRYLTCYHKPDERVYRSP